MPRTSDTMPVTLDAAENDPIFSGRSRVGHQLGGEFCLVDVTVGVLVDGDHVGDGLAPGQLVGVVLEGPDEHDRTLRRRNRSCQVVAVLEVGGDPQAEDADQLVDGCGRPGAGEDDDSLGVAADCPVDDLAGVLAQPARLEAGAAGLGVGVGVAGEHLVDG